VLDVSALDREHGESGLGKREHSINELVGKTNTPGFSNPRKRKNNEEGEIENREEISEVSDNG